LVIRELPKPKRECIKEKLQPVYGDLEIDFPAMRISFTADHLGYANFGDKTLVYA